MLPLGSQGSAGGSGCSLGVSLKAAMLLSIEAVTNDFKPVGRRVGGVTSECAPFRQVNRLPFLVSSRTRAALREDSKARKVPIGTSGEREPNDGFFSVGTMVLIKLCAD